MPGNEVTYSDLTFPETHPSSIAGIASVIGLHPPPVATCRVLELGCGTGFNLLAISQSLPNAHCVGIDYDPAHIRRATETAAAIGASNVHFHCQSIHDFPAREAPFDYILAHGLFSWVPAETRAAILALIQSHLSPNGLAYLSYNTNPGWHLRSLTRHAMSFFAAPSTDPAARVQLARKGLEHLTKSLLNPDSPYAHALLSEATPLAKAPDYYIAHEYTIPDNNPLYFTDFVAEAAQHQLQFAAEARYPFNSFVQAKDLRLLLDEGAGPDILRREQYLDLLAGRYFRQSLLCHADRPLHHDIDTDRLLDLKIAQTNPASQSPDPPLQRVLDHLKRTAPHAIPARSVQADVLEAIGSDALPGFADQVLAAVLSAGWRSGLWSLRPDSPPMTAESSSRPTACPLARLQAANGPTCTNRLHHSVTLPADQQQLLATLDGTTETQDPALHQLAAQGFLIA